MELYLGQEFPSTAASLHAVEDYAWSRNKLVKNSSRGGTSRKIVCSCAKCSFFVWFVKKKRGLFKLNPGIDNVWRICSMNLTHSATCTSLGVPNRRQIAQMPNVRSKVLSNAKVKCPELIRLIDWKNPIDHSNISRPLRLAVYNAKNDILSQLAVKYESAIQRIPALLRDFERRNPGSVAQYEDQDGDLRAILVAQPIVHAQIFNQRILALESIPIRHQQLKGYQLELLGRDGDGNRILMAFAIVPNELPEQYVWFLSHAQQRGIDFHDVPILADGLHEGMAQAIEAMGFDLHFSLNSILYHTSKRFNYFLPKHWTTIQAIRAAESTDLFLLGLHLLEESLGEVVTSYLSRFPPEKWCVHASSVSLYNWIDTDAHLLEISNEIQDERGPVLDDPSPFGLMLHAMSRMKHTLQQNQVNALMWTNEKRMLTERATVLYQEQLEQVEKYHVTPQSEQDVFSVWSLSRIPLQKRSVNLDLKTCSCLMKGQIGIPCRHYLAVLKHVHQLEDLMSSTFDPCYLVANFNDAYAESHLVVPVESELAV